jgi:hypothetical protein
LTRLFQWLWQPYSQFACPISQPGLLTFEFSIMIL